MRWLFLSATTVQWIDIIKIEDYHLNGGILHRFRMLNWEQINAFDNHMCM